MDGLGLLLVYLVVNLLLNMELLRLLETNLKMEYIIPMQPLLFAMFWRLVLSERFFHAFLKCFFF